MPADGNNCCTGFCPDLKVFNRSSGNRFWDQERMDGNPKIGKRRKRYFNTFLVSLNNRTGKNITQPPRLNRSHLSSAWRMISFLEGIHLDGPGFCEKNCNCIAFIGLKFIFCSDPGNCLLYTSDAADE